jgi:hypothetical protein
MRLYTKLLVMILLTGAFQHFAPPSAWGGDAWFMIRCHAANVMGDKRLAAQMVEEHYRTIRSVAEEELIEIETSNRLAWEAEERATLTTAATAGDVAAPVLPAAATATVTATATPAAAIPRT